MATTSDPEHLTGDVLRLGVVAAVDPGGATCMVESGGVVAFAVGGVAGRGLAGLGAAFGGRAVPGAFARGDLGNGIVLPGLYCDAFRRRPISLILSVLLSPMGRGSAMIRCAMRWLSRCPQGQHALDAPGGLTIHGDVTVNGSLTASGDVVGGVSQGPPAFRAGGSGQTGAPV
jgi:hypothetical protein